MRDMIESDIEDYVRWFTVETEWGDWDAPWEPLSLDEDKERRSWTEYYESVRSMPKETLRRKFEIECGGVHVGCVSRYTDLDYMENPEEIPAVGLFIPDVKKRRKGIGTAALTQFIEYLHANGYNAVYTQTWSGNIPMVKLAEKLGFREVCRKRNLREVRGAKYDAITWRLDL